MSFPGDDKPVMGDLYTEVVHKRYVVHWEELGLKLGLTNDQIETISYNNQHNPKRAQNCCTAMFKEWLRVDPAPTWGKLSDAVHEIKVALKTGKYN